MFTVCELVGESYFKFEEFTSLQQVAVPINHHITNDDTQRTERNNTLTVKYTYS